MNASASSNKNHRFPIALIVRTVWHYFRFNVSLSEAGDMVLERGVAVSYETIRRWCRAHGSRITAIAPQDVQRC